MIWLPFSFREAIYSHISGSLLSVTLKKERDTKFDLISLPPDSGIFCEIIALDSLFLCCCKCLVMHGDDSILTHARFERGEVDRTKMKGTS